MKITKERLIKLIREEVGSTPNEDELLHLIQDNSLTKQDIVLLLKHIAKEHNLDLVELHHDVQRFIYNRKLSLEQ